jgi:hypothetical protein
MRSVPGHHVSLLRRLSHLSPAPPLHPFTTTVPQLPANTITAAEVKMTEIIPDYAQRTVGIDFSECIGNLCVLYPSPDRAEYLRLMTI